MSGEISKAESWSTVYKAYQNINFSAFDYDSVKASLLDYIKTYHPENFNDFIENSEIVALVEVFSYVAELLAYRQDMNAHENFMSLAQRKQSVLQLAKYISYNAGRNLPPRGLVKMTSVQTTEDVFDSKGNNLANKRITWNDTNNPNWREQFFIVMNLVLEQEYGSVAPNDRIQVDDVVFELYRMNNRPLQLGVMKYNATSGGQTYPMELVPVALDSDGPFERRPAKNSTFSILYGSDGLGNSSDTTGFFMFTKQGALSKLTKSFDGITPNQTLIIGSNNINDVDVWINQIDPDTGLTNTTSVIDALGRRLNPAGEWIQVDAANVENVIYNTNLNRNKYELETLENDNVRIIFGDGEFADVPSGMFDIWFRTSTSGSGIILQNSVVNQTSALTYLNNQSKLQTFTFTFSLVNSLTNGAATEDVERIRRFAPSIYYTQDRMVNGRDYNNYLLQDQSIVKLRAVNRSFAGESKYLSWHDPSEYYEDVKIFGDDLTMYYTTTFPHKEVSNAAPLFFIRNFVQPLLVSTGVYLSHALKYLATPNREFTSTELGTLDESSNNTILGEMQKGLKAPSNFKVYLVYRPVYGTGQSTPIVHNWMSFGDNAIDLEPSLAAEATFVLEYTRSEAKWRVTYTNTEQIVRSGTTHFWFNNGSNKTIVEDTLNAELDEVVLLKANVNTAGKLLTRNIPLNVIGSAMTTIFPNAGQQDTYALSVMSPDQNGDGIPDDLASNEILAESYLEHPPIQSGGTTIHKIQFPVDKLVDVVAGYDQLAVVLNGKRFISNTSPEYTTVNEVGQTIPNVSQSLYYFKELNAAGTQATYPQEVKAIEINLTPIVNPITPIEIQFNQFAARYPLNVAIYKRSFAYFYKNAPEDTDWIAASALQVESKRKDWIIPANRNIVTRFYGINALNFAWFHRTPRYHIIDPSVTNIVDMFVITGGYYTELRGWLRGDISDRPIPPTSLELRTSFAQLLEARMMSDAVVIHPGKFKILFGKNADSILKASLKVIPSTTGRLTSNELKVQIVDVVRNFFDADNWEFGETFYFSELSAAIHSSLPGELDSVVLVPESTNSVFGDMFELAPQEDELFIPDITVDNIEIIEHLSAKTLKQ